MDEPHNGITCCGVYRSAADRRQRIAQLVREYGEELILVPVRLRQRELGFLAIGHIEKEDG